LILFLFEQGVQMLTEKNWIFSPIHWNSSSLSLSFFSRLMMKSPPT